MAKEKNWRLFLYACYCTGSLSLLIRVKVSSVLIMYRVSIFYLCPQMFVTISKTLNYMQLLTCNTQKDYRIPGVYCVTNFFCVDSGGICLD